MNINDGLIDLLINHEEMLGQLYSEYARRFPGHAEFWTQLSSEEQNHAQSIRQLGEYIEKNAVRINNEHITIKAVKISMEYINDQIARAQNENLILTNALSITYQIEKSLIDGKIDEVFKGYTQDARRFIRELGNTLLQHFTFVEQEWHNYQRFA